MGARQLGVLRLFMGTAPLWAVTQNPESIPSPSHDPQSWSLALIPCRLALPGCHWLLAGPKLFHTDARTAKEVGVHGAPPCPGAAHSRCPLATGCPSLRARLYAVSRSVSESPP